MAQILLTVDLSYGDSGKGTMVDAFTRHKATELIVRYSGGAQASHNVISPQGVHHRFAQLGSGTLVPGVKTYLGPDMLVDPHKILVENSFIERAGVHDALSRLTIDEKTPLITEFNVIINQTREFERKNERHGSCGMGIYETRIDSRTYGDEMLRAEDMLNTARAKEKLLFFRAEKLKVLRRDFPHLYGDPVHPSAQAAYRIFTDDRFIEETLQIYAKIASKVRIANRTVISDAVATGKQVIFEASQGVLLDENHGFLPNVTGSDVTSRGAHELLASIGIPKENMYTLGIVRAYMSRHGAGPLVTEDANIDQYITEIHNPSTHPWQGAFRFGWFDPLAIRYAIAATGGIDGLAVTCLDQIKTLPTYKYATAYTTAAGASMEDIPFNKDAEEEERLSLTATLRGARPAYASCAPNPNEIIEVISSTCNTKIAATSQGRSALEKHILI